MQEVLLAPVPRHHIAAARDIARRAGGRVAFGTGANDPGKMWEFFSTKVHSGMQVLLHVSATGEGEHHGAVFSHRAIFDRIVAGEREVSHLRPESTADDTGYQLFWVARDFEELAKADWVSFARVKITPPLDGPLVKHLHL